MARYSDTKGYVYAREERFFVHAPAYRDWVVRAFNEDLPYDRFLLLQIAADQAAPDDRAALAAMGFLTLGRRFLGVTHDIIDDRIDVVTRGTMGLTVGCARCHDHKYDPIPTADYYSLYGVFQNCTERLVPIAEPATRDKAYEAFEAELKKRQQALADAMAKAREEASRTSAGKRLTICSPSCSSKSIPRRASVRSSRKDDLIPAFVRRWQAYLAERWRRPTTRSFGPGGDLRVCPTTSSASSGDVVARTRRGERRLSTRSWRRRSPRRPRRCARSPSGTGKCSRRSSGSGESSWRKIAAAKALPDADAEALRQVLYGPHSPCVVPDEPIVSTSGSSTCQHGEPVEAPGGGRPLADPVAAGARVRGGPGRSRGDAGAARLPPRQSGDQGRRFRGGSSRWSRATTGSRSRTAAAGWSWPGRSSPDNPLTARVWVNRVWMHHFGAGLVRTPSDFGIRAEPPSHPELLDWLARRLVAEGWSTKALHRLILLSAAYQQRSDGRTTQVARQQALAIDPENRLLWRMNPRRLTFEESRDTLLAVSGELDRTIGGRAADLFPAGSDNRRRTLYGLVDRQFLPGVLRAFDFANPDLHIPQRSETTVPQQALFAMNHPFVADRARGLVARLGEIPSTDRGRPRAAALPGGLPARADRVASSRRRWRSSIGAAGGGAGRPARDARLAVRLRRVRRRGPRATFTRCRTSPARPGKAARSGPTRRSAGSSSPPRAATRATTSQHAAIRRWTAPRAERSASSRRRPTRWRPATASAAGSSPAGTASLASAVLQPATVVRRRPRSQVEAGDTIDFVVDFRESQQRPVPLGARRSASWRPACDEDTVWDVVARLRRAPTHCLTPWEQLAQVLLMANELMFVD